MTLQRPEGIDPKYLKVSYLPPEGSLSRRDLLFGPLTPRYEVVPAVEAEACTAWKGCRQCLTACPQQAIAIDGSAAAIEKAKCVGCGACLPACPTWAIRQPLLDPDRLEAELRDLFLPADDVDARRILVVVADGGPAPDALANLPSLQLPSVGAISPWLLLRPFTLGAAGVVIVPCRPGCRHRCDQDRWERTLGFCRDLLAGVGVGGDRLLVIAREEATAVAALGPVERHVAWRGTGTPRLAEVVQGLAAGAPAPVPPLVGRGVPLGAIRIEASRCTFCGACAERCPTGALRLEEDGGASRLSFDHARCVACEVCVEVCPEKAVEMERRIEFSRLGRSRILAEDRVARCRSCGASIAPESMLRKVEGVLGRPQPSGRECPSCQMLQSLARG